MTDEATRIRIIRAYTGEQAGDFAARLGVSRQSLTEWEAGRSVPGLRAGKALAKVLKDAKLILLPSGYPVPISDVTFEE